MDGRPPGRSRVCHTLANNPCLSANKHRRPRTMFAEMLSDMYTETLNSVNENSREMCVFIVLLRVYSSRHTAVSQPIFPSLCDHASYIPWIVGISNLTDSLMKKSSPVLYYYSRPSSELKECERLFQLPCVSVLSSPSYLQRDGRLMFLQLQNKFQPSSITSDGFIDTKILITTLNMLWMCYKLHNHTSSQREWYLLLRSFSNQLECGNPKNNLTVVL